MEIPPEISFRDVDHGERHERKIREEIEKLERYFDRITRCRVVVDMPHRHSEQGNRYHVGVRLTVPTKELVVSRDPGPSEGYADLDSAISSAFQSMRRQLEEYTDQLRRNQKKSAEGFRSGKIVRLLSDEGYGFIRTPDGRDVYFHRDTLVNADLEDLSAQTPVQYVEEEGEKGPQAREVYVLTREAPPSVAEA